MNDLVAGLNNGSINPKGKVVEMLSSLNPAQKSKLKMLLPFACNVARKRGVAEQNINAFLQEVNQYL